MRFMGKHRGRCGTIGLDLGGCIIKAAQLRESDRPRELPTLTAAVALDRLNPGGPFDVREAVRLRQVLDRRGFVGRRVVVSAPGKSAITGVLALPPMKDGLPMDQIVRAELAHAHRQDEDALAVAWWALPRPARSGAGTHAMAVGCPHAAADELIAVLHRGGFDVVGLDMEGWAVARACEPIIAAKSDMAACVGLGWDATTLVLLHEGVVVYERSSFGSGIGALRKALEADRQYSAEVIDYLLHEIGFELTTRGTDEDRRWLGTCATQLQAHFQQITREIALALDYAHSQYPAATVTTVLLTGGGGGIPGITEHLAASLDAPVAVVRPRGVVLGAESFGALADLPALLPAIGLAKRHVPPVRKEAA